MIDRLSPREREVVLMIAEGLSNRQMATRMNVSLKTVSAHKSHAADKLGVRTRLELAEYARGKR